MNDRPIAAVLGAGGAGQGVAAYMAHKGYRVHLWNRPNPDEERLWLQPIREQGCLEVLLTDPGPVSINLVTTDLGEAVAEASLVLLTASSESHRELAVALAPLLRAGQTVALLTGGTGGALDFRAGLAQAGAPHGDQVMVVETLTTILNSNAVAPGQVRINGIKSQIPAAALPGRDTMAALARLADLPLAAAPDVLTVGLANFAVTNHVPPMVLNASRIESTPEGFLWYPHGMTDSVVRVVARIDAERASLAEALGLHTVTLREYLADSVGEREGDLASALRNARLYAVTPAPRALDHRWLWEDTLTGTVPMVSLGRALGRRLPLLEGCLAFAEAILERDLWSEGRTVERLGLAGLTPEQIRERVRG
ncbi:MAG: NAD/NADP octopine/nopaline dehydrogenase family protein [Chloroflexi bacterium]|nr:NAD/NADP octopine/nopaline dehydrogenase family protein [Chloroflexota bacterium]